MLLHVESQPGLHGDPEPHSFLLRGRTLGVLCILDRWIAPDHSYFKLQATDGGTYILRYAPAERHWELISFQAPGS